MPRKTLSEFHYSKPLIDGSCLASSDALHDELSFKLGFPDSYGRNWDALLDCLSSIGESNGSFCRHWDLRDGKRMVLWIYGMTQSSTDPSVLTSLVAVVADANARLSSDGSLNRIWIEFNTQTPNGA